jgi:hypothetical protein
MIYLHVIQRPGAGAPRLALMLVSTFTNFCVAKEKPNEDNAYRMEMLDLDGKTVATAIIWTPKFNFKERPSYTAKCTITILQTKSKNDAVVTFNHIIPKPDDIVEVEVQSFPNSSPNTPPEMTPIRLCVNFNPGAHDWNVKAVTDQSKDGFTENTECKFMNFQWFQWSSVHSVENFDFVAICHDPPLRTPRGDRRMR